MLAEGPWLPHITQKVYRNKAIGNQSTLWVLMHMLKQDNIRKRTILTLKTFQFQKISNQRVKIGEN